MISGRLRYNLTFRRRTTSKDALGAFQDSYSTLATRRGSLEPLNGREYWQASGEHSAVDTRIRVRYDAALASLKASDEVLDATHSPQVVYDIQAVIRPRETAKELVLMCVRRSG